MDAYQTWIEISASALAQNALTFSEVVGKQRAGFVLKANAYGHGLSTVFEALKATGSLPPFLLTNYVSEAITLKKLGFSGRLISMGPLGRDELEAAAQAGIEVFLSSAEALSVWKSLKQKGGFHLKFDTGMSRQGFFPEEAKRLSEELGSAERVLLKGACSHFSNVEDVYEHAYADQQIAKFEIARKAFPGLFSHIASSASALLLPPSRFDLCRIGISLYGLWPSPATRLSYGQMHDGQLATLVPALAWRTVVRQVKEVSKGVFIGYGCTFRTSAPMRVAVLPVGYAEGYPRLAGTKQSYVLISGQRCRIVGRICMNMMMVDVTHVNSVAVGDTVTLIGRDGQEQISAHEVSEWAETIPYELLTRLPESLPRRIVT